MEIPSVTVTFSAEDNGRTLADCLESLLCHLNLETPEEDPA